MIVAVRILHIKKRTRKIGEAPNRETLITVLASNLNIESSHTHTLVAKTEVGQKDTVIAVTAVIAVIEVGQKDTGAIVTCDRSSDSSDSCFGHVGQFARNMFFARPPPPKELDCLDWSKLSLRAQVCEMTSLSSIRSFEIQSLIHRAICFAKVVYVVDVLW